MLQRRFISRREILDTPRCNQRGQAALPRPELVKTLQKVEAAKKTAETKNMAANFPPWCRFKQEVGPLVPSASRLNRWVSGLKTVKTARRAPPRPDGGAGRGG